jgi:Uncharacterized protein conserved in bacteria (DUF2186).
MFPKKEQPQKSEHSKEKLTNLFAKKSSDIIRVLLVSYPKTWSMRDLAKESGAGLGHTSRVSKTLIKQRIALRASARSELKVMAPTDLLQRWASYSNFVANTTFLEYYSQEDDIGKFLNGFKDKENVHYALTGLAGALLVEPFVRPTNIHIYINNEFNATKLAHNLGLMPIEDNGNVKFAIANSDGIFYGAQEINGIWIVSDIQLYVDLYNYPARGREAAEVLYRKIEKRWDEVLG